ncbi:MAG: hypothetical protein J1E57_04180 [Prevotella sp.]|nr:hypothetical protein [Prevotella sp.]
MKNLAIKGLAVFAMMFLASSQVSAQGFLKKLTKTAESVTKTTSTETTETASTDTADVKALKWDEIPVYTIKEVIGTNSDGSVATNEDGTLMKSYQLVDQFGNVRSAEAVKEQQRKINKAIGNIIAKVGGGAALGAATTLIAGGNAKDAIVGGAAGAAAGLALSADDIKKAKALKKSMKDQKALLAMYEKNFTAEGQPVAANAKGMAEVENLVKGESMSLTAELYKETLNSPQYASADDWEVPTI